MPYPLGPAMDAGPWSPIFRCIDVRETNVLHGARTVPTSEDERPQGPTEHEEALTQLRATSVSTGRPRASRVPPVPAGERGGGHDRTSRAMAGRRLGQLGVRLGTARPHRVRDAVGEVFVDQEQGDGLQRRRHRRHLAQDVDAVAVVLDHSAECPAPGPRSAQALSHLVLLWE